MGPLEADKPWNSDGVNGAHRFIERIYRLYTEGNIKDYIQTNELMYEELVDDIAKKVATNRKIKAIFMSGPSSSGKTTSSRKLSLCLKAKGIDTLVISTDDYFLEREKSPKDESGNYDFERVEALDYDLFRNHIKKLLMGEEIVIPTYNFIAGQKEFKRKPITLKEKQVLIVEGLHAVSEKLNGSIAKQNKLTIYLSPFTPISLDRHNHISTTDVRLLRRMVRDFNHRGYSAEATLNSWLRMRASEEKNVYPYQRETDIILNTSLSYEIGVLRTYAEPLLYSVNPDSPVYEEAIMILNFLKGFINIPSEDIPSTSILREFIGNSYFE
jgi:uridine kinase